ncbi:hypothetical protein YC2023_090249 [Brassica napus]
MRMNAGESPSIKEFKSLSIHLKELKDIAEAQCTAGVLEKIFSSENNKKPICRNFNIS